LNADFEVAESCKLIPAIQRHVMRQGLTLQDQALWLESHVMESVNKKRFTWGENERVGLIAELSLLSEIYATLDFDKMIEVREKFQDLFPEHFERYLDNLESLSMQMFWPGCLECRNFDGKCELGLTPGGVWDRNSRFDRNCDSKEERLRAA
jgi:hypothetical protein